MKIILLAVAFTIAFSFVAAPVLAQDAVNEACTGANFGDAAAGCTGTELGGSIRKVTNVISFIVGIISVIVAIIAGLMYTVSAGDPQKTKQAKDALLFAIVGLVVAIMAYAIASFVVTQVGTRPPTEAVPEYASPGYYIKPNAFL